MNPLNAPVRPYFSSPYIVARLPNDPIDSFTVFSTRPEDVAKSQNLHTVTFGPKTNERSELWAIIAYATSYAGLMGALDLLNANWNGWVRIEGAS